MLAQPRPAPLQGSLVEQKATPISTSAIPPFSYTTSTTTTTVVTTTTTTTTTTKTESQAPTAAETKTAPAAPESKVLPKVPAGGKIGTRISSAPVLPPSPPSSIHGLECEQGGVQPDGQGLGGVGDDEEDNRVELTQEVFLPPPPPITRRNTTGSIKKSSPNQSPKKSYLQTSKSPLSEAPHPAFPLPHQGGFGEGSLDLASDIYKYSEKIRRERNLKRSKQLQQQQREQLGAEKRVEVGIAAATAASALENEPGPSAAHSTIPGTSLGSAITTNAIATAVGFVEALDEKPLVGNLIGEGHVNYVLMYNMLTGIRIAVSRCGGKIMRPIGEEDFRAEHKYSFDMWVIFLFVCLIPLKFSQNWERVNSFR